MTLAEARQQITDLAVRLRKSKGHDYCGKRLQENPDWNFEYAAAFASLVQGKDFTAGDVLAVLLGIKFARRLALKTVPDIQHEPLLDTAADAQNYQNYLFARDLTGKT